MPMIGEIANTHPGTLASTATVREAAALMASIGVGEVIVYDPDDHHVVGLLTDRDVATRVVAMGLDATHTSVGAVCDHDVPTVGVSEDIETAESLMGSQAVRHLPVVDRDQRAVAILGLDDLAGSAYVKDKTLGHVMHSIASAERTRRVATRT
jgi:CBS domain-containing protein